MTRVLLIDGGQSGCRAALLEDGAVIARASGPGLSRMGRRYEALAGLMDAPYDVVAAGLTGFRGGGLGGIFSAPLIVTNDAVTAYLGALGDEPGVVVVAGTGVIALAAGEERVERADGHGPLLGDRGGGFWIGRRGLRAALAGHAALAEAAAGRYGPDIIRGVYDAADPVAAIAAFAVDVATLARAGDADAAEIWDAAGRELARTVAPFPGPVSWAGGLFAAGELILAPFREELGRELRPPRGDALDGAARLLERPARFADMIEEVP